MKVEILNYTSGEAVLNATISVDADGEPVINGRLPVRIEQEVLAAHVRAGGDGDTFLKSLPTVFSGSYIRARLVH